MQNTSKNRAPAPQYVSPKQLSLPGFESPFERKLNPNNRWIVLSKLLPWDELCSIYWKHIPEKETGRTPLNPRIVLGAIIIKHLCDLDDRETVEQISENIYMQYFLGYSSFCDVPPFDATLFVEFRKRLGLEQMNEINERISKIKQELKKRKQSKNGENGENNDGNLQDITHKGSLITDATACPQDIAFPTDLDLLNDAREKSEELMDILFAVSTMQKKPRNYREKARKEYLKVAQKKTKTRKDIRTALNNVKKALQNPWEI